MDELARVRDAVKPLNILLVLDAMTGQEAVNVAEAFQERIAFDGVVLTKLDGDARGGAALSVKAITGKPIKFASVGEKLDQLEVFHPDRMASRILGMGDVLTLIEKAEAAVARGRAGGDGAPDARRRVHLRRLPPELPDAAPHGAVKGVLKLLPGVGQQLDGLDIDEKQMARVEAIVLSMTPHERSVPHLINGPRRRRIAAGSGTSIDEVNRLLAARKQMQKMMKQFGKGKMPMLPPELTGGAGGRDGADDRHNPGPTGNARRRRMAVRMRLTRIGSKKNPIYRVVVADSRSPRDGRFIEIVGRYNPQTDPSTIELDEAKVKDWLSKGAQPSDPVAKLIKAAGITA